MESFSISSLVGTSTNELNLPTSDPLVRIHKTAQTMEGLFVGQLMSEMSKGGQIAGCDTSENASYHDFIQQAMTQTVTKGTGFGLAPSIEKYLIHAAHLDTPPKPKP